MKDKEIAELNAGLFEQEETKARLAAREMDMASKDTEIAELKSRLLESSGKCESLELDVGAEKARAEAAEEARDTAQSTLNNTQTAHAQAESLVELLMNNSVWLQQRGIVYVSNAVLNSVELDTMVTTLTISLCNDGYAEGYHESTRHVTEALKVKWDTQCSAIHGKTTGDELLAAH
ncbi:hypothetical protein Hdeb2414_s0011g00362271 [Helianthus debilis subsp. tardiflorus]